MKIYITSFFILCTFICQSQTIKGKLFGQSGDGREILPGGSIQWLGNATKVLVNDNGVFELSTTGITDLRIVASFAGYKTDTIPVAGRTYISINLQKEQQQLDAVVVEANRSFVTNSVGKVEVIGRKELSKAACCDLAGCFGTQSSVQAHTTNIVTNAQELRILGLSGVYNQLLVDGLPVLQGSTYTYGISTYPGTVVENIYVSKGNTSVLQGYESISGQINLETRQPETTEKLHLNAYINSFGEKHLNANIGGALTTNKKWNSLLALHVVQPAGRIDGNDDGFLDLPLLARYAAFNKWNYRNNDDSGFSMQLALRFVHEKRLGGQNSFSEKKDKGSNTVYGQWVNFNQPEASAKIVYRFSPASVLGFAASYSFHDQDAWFGITSYKARQHLAYFNLQHALEWNNKHQLKYGASYRFQQLQEKILFSSVAPDRSYAGDYNTALKVPGVFVENTFNFAENKLSVITGARADHHQQHGWYFTPRGMLKYSINKDHTFRASAGTGWRQVNLFSEQAMILTSSRDIVFAEQLMPEKAFNWGLSHTYKFTWGKSTGTLSADFYHTSFSNQFFPDYDVDATKIVIQNFSGPSASNGLQVEGSIALWKQLELRAAYNYLDVYQEKSNEKILLPFNPKNRIMMAASFKTKNNQWQADVNGNWFDKMRLPNTQSNPEPYRRPLYSDAYSSINVQGTFRKKRFEVYAGCENIFNYRQPDPIISADNPFGPYFDLSSVWGPTRGREMYVGLRYSIR